MFNSKIFIIMVTAQAERPTSKRGNDKSDIKDTLTKEKDEGLARLKHQEAAEENKIQDLADAKDAMIRREAANVDQAAAVASVVPETALLGRIVGSMSNWMKKKKEAGVDWWKKKQEEGAKNRLDAENRKRMSKDEKAADAVTKQANRRDKPTGDSNSEAYESMLTIFVLFVMLAHALDIWLGFTTLQYHILSYVFLFIAGYFMGVFNYVAPDPRQATVFKLYAIQFLIPFLLLINSVSWLGINVSLLGFTRFVGAFITFFPLFILLVLAGRNRGWLAGIAKWYTFVLFVVVFFSFVILPLASSPTGILAATGLSQITIKATDYDIHQSINYLWDLFKNFWKQGYQYFTDLFYYATTGYYPSHTTEKIYIGMALYDPGDNKLKYDPDNFPEPIQISANIDVFVPKGPITVTPGCDLISSADADKNDSIKRKPQRVMSNIPSIIDPSFTGAITCFAGTPPQGNYQLIIKANASNLVTTTSLTNYFVGKAVYDKVAVYAKGKPVMDREDLRAALAQVLQINAVELPQTQYGLATIVLHTSDVPVILAELPEDTKTGQSIGQSIKLTAVIQNNGDGSILGLNYLKITLPEGLIVDKGSDVKVDAVATRTDATLPGSSGGAINSCPAFTASGTSGVVTLRLNSNYLKRQTFKDLKKGQQQRLPDCYLAIGDSAKLLSTGRTEANPRTFIADMNYDYVVEKSYDIQYGKAKAATPSTSTGTSGNSSNNSSSASGSGTSSSGTSSGAVSSTYSADEQIKSDGTVSPLAVYNYLMTKSGMDSNKAKGIIANLQAESNFKPASVGDNGMSYGMFQHYDTRRDKMVAACPNWRTDWKCQVNFALSESASLTYLRTDFLTAEDASRWWTMHWEIPANAQLQADNRVANLNNFASFG